jgi:hypothetical protein
MTRDQATPLALDPFGLTREPTPSTRPTVADLAAAEVEVKQSADALHEAQQEAERLRPPGTPFMLRVSQAEPPGPWGDALRRLGAAQSAAQDALDKLARIRAALNGE